MADDEVARMRSHIKTGLAAALKQAEADWKRSVLDYARKAMDGMDSAYREGKPLEAIVQAAYARLYLDLAERG